MILTRRQLLNMKSFFVLKGFEIVIKKLYVLWILIEEHISILRLFVFNYGYKFIEIKLWPQVWLNHYLCSCGFKSKLIFYLIYLAKKLTPNNYKLYHALLNCRVAPNNYIDYQKNVNQKQLLYRKLNWPWFTANCLKSFQSRVSE